MRDRVLAYSLAASVGLHLIILCLVGRTSATKPIELDNLKIVKVEMVSLADDSTSKPQPTLTRTQATVQLNHPGKSAVAPVNNSVFSSSERTPKQTKPNSSARNTSESRTTGYSTSGQATTSPGGPLNYGRSSTNGVPVGSSGNTPLGWVPGDPGGRGKGSGSDLGTGTPEPEPRGDRGHEMAPNPVPPPPPPPRMVKVTVCAKSGKLPNQYCEQKKTIECEEGKEPHSICDECKAPFVSTYAPATRPELISGRQSPKYPAGARSRGEEGDVTVQYTIDTNGDVVGATVVVSSGSKDLDRAAIECVESRKYKPATQDGKPRKYPKRETFHFRLSKS